MIDPRIDLRNIETFYYITKLGTFLAAAEKLHTSQPAISQRISLLEEAVGHSLFSRDKRRVSLTSKGRELLAHAENMLQLYQKMNVAVCSNTQSMSGTIRISVAETLSYTWIPRLIHKLYEAYPELTVDVQVTTKPIMEAKLVNQQVDLIFLDSLVQGQNIESMPLCQYPRNWLVGPKFDKGSLSVSQECLAEQPIITYSSDSENHNVIQTLLKNLGIRTPHIYPIESLPMILEMVHQNAGIALLSPVFFRQKLANGELRILDIEGVMPPTANYMASWISGPNSYIPNMVAQLGQQIAQEEQSLVMQ